MADGSEGLRSGVSRELDVLSSSLMGDALDFLAEGRNVDMLLAVQDDQGNLASFSFEDDVPEELLRAAKAKVHELDLAGGDPETGLGVPQRYAMTYEGVVADETGAYQDALMLEFGERGWRSYSAYSFFDGRGKGDGFRWTDPAAAGEVDPLL